MKHSFNARLLRVAELAGQQTTSTVVAATATGRMRRFLSALPRIRSASGKLPPEDFAAEHVVRQVKP